VWKKKRGLEGHTSVEYQMMIPFDLRPIRQNGLEGQLRAFLCI
jgi:hypothetical protein